MLFHYLYRLENYHLTVTLVKEEDGGEYEVRAENEFGSVSSKSTVTIHSEYRTTINIAALEPNFTTNYNRSKNTEFTLIESITNTVTYLTT